MRVAAIDVGSNALRLVLGEFQDSGSLLVLDSEREAVRLGKDVFHSGKIGPALTRSCIRALLRFDKLAKLNSVQKIRVIATSAVREASNCKEFCAQIEQETGLKLEVVSGIEEARLVIVAVQNKIELTNLCALLLDIGGGSIELSLVDNGVVVRSKSAPLGTVRMLEGNPPAVELASRISLGIDEALQDFESELKKRNCELLIGTGGNIECLGELKVEILNKKGRKEVSAEQHQQVLYTLLKMSPEERIERYHLREDRVDVIIPAALVVQEIFQQTGISHMLIPRVGLKEGVLWDMRPT